MGRKQADLQQMGGKGNRRPNSPGKMTTQPTGTKKPRKSNKV
jgi:hypothetical protein